MFIKLSRKLCKSVGLNASKVGAQSKPSFHTVLKKSKIPLSSKKTYTFKKDNRDMTTEEDTSGI